ncbi:O-antigen ligase family protein [Qipengyuania flava]|uniref:O-antigen ligase family protein n=1 Tax=Qipengyuania flava TaxID=192812 RepID=UPI0012FD8B0F|nr:O-antigen ligase family protein [Qipengyuania flava]
MRFVAAFAVGFALLIIDRDALSRIAIPLSLIGLIAVIALIQLVPLPPELWASLPEREMIAAIDELVAIDIWRPITLSPAATINTLGALFVPSMVLLWLAIKGDARGALQCFLGLGVLSALLGILQLFSDPQSGIYLYELTNRGSAVGLFANRNHQAVFLACCLLVSLHLAQGNVIKVPWHRWAYIGSAFLFTLAILVNGSRAGLLTLTIAVFMSLSFAMAARRSPKSVERRPSGWLAPSILAGSGVLLVGIFLAAQRVPAFSRLMERNVIEDLRADLLPISIDMARDFLPWGTGFGAFEHAYRMREPSELLMPAYVNEAHNDWLQFVIEGGLPALLLVIAGMAWAVLRVFKMMRAPASDWQANGLRWLGFGILTILAVASSVDYPLRVPSIMALAITALALMATPPIREI